MNDSFSIIVSLFNEERGVLAFWNDLNRVLELTPSKSIEIIWVNDGSSDNTQQLINQIIDEQGDKSISHVALEFSKNFGHEAAMIAGIDTASGDVIICMDSDGQHPPAEISKMISSYQAGNDIVLMNRAQRKDNGSMKKSLSFLFYKILNGLSHIKIQENSTDFFLISRQVADILKSNYRDQNRFIRGYIQSIGFSKETLAFEAPARTHGESNYSYKKLFRLSLDAVFTFSFRPLHISIFFSIVFVLLTIVFVIYSLYMYIYEETIPSGYTSIILFLSFSFSLLFLTITILSMYFEKSIREIRKRPIYIVKDKRES